MIGATDCAELSGSMVIPSVKSRIMSGDEITYAPKGRDGFAIIVDTVDYDELAPMIVVTCRRYGLTYWLCLSSDVTVRRGSHINSDLTVGSVVTGWGDR